MLRLRNATYCTDFNTNLVSFQLLRENGIFWDTINNLLIRRDGSTICIVHQMHNQFVLQYREITRDTENAIFSTQYRRRTSRNPRAPAVAIGSLWHLRMGHPSPLVLHHLGKNSLGTRIRGPKTTQCSGCSQGKIHRQISRRPPDREKDKPCYEIWVDWTDIDEDSKGFVRAMFITDAWSGMVFPYYTKTYDRQESGKILRHFYLWMKNHYGYLVRVVRSDNELFTKKIKYWMMWRGIVGKPSAPNTQAQNGGAERSGGVIIEKSRVMRITANLPHDLWREIISAAVYLKNRTPRDSNGWKTPYELFYSKQPYLSHLKAYGCRAYAMTSRAQLKRKKLRKLDPRAHIGYLVGYDSTNIFRIWVPHKGKVISTRDVIFDEDTFFDGKCTEKELIDSVDELVEKVAVPPSQLNNQTILEEDEPVFESGNHGEGQDDDEGEMVPDDDREEDRDDQADKEDYELARAMEEAFRTPPPTEPDQEQDAALSVFLPVAGAEGVRADNPPTAIVESCLDDFVPVPIETAYHGSFVAGMKFKPKKIHKRNLPDEPKTLKDLDSHPFKEQFRNAQEDHMASHRQMKSFVEVPWRQAKGQQVLSCMWVFTYKTDKHGYLVKCKARLVVCGNQQAKGDLPTRATTLASMSFRALMAIAAEHDLELVQMDAVNAFVHCELDELVFMRMPPGFQKYGTVLKLRKALYGLRRSPLLWQQDLTQTLRDLGFKTVPEEPCVMLRDGVIVFFFVDDLIWAYRKERVAEATKAMESLQQKYNMTVLGEPKWFLGIHIIRNRARRTIWLTQDAYIDKIAHQHGVDLEAKIPETPMTEEELLPATCQADRHSIEKYLKKVGSILFAAISTRPDVAFAAARLARFNQNPDQTHHKAADRVLQYLHGTRSLGIRLGGTRFLKSFLCASDASYADNTMDRKSSQGYVMMLFGGPIAWKATKQPTVTTSSTEAELIALSETAKEAIFASRILKELEVQIDGPLHIECDNTQTIRLLTEESAKLTTKLRHVDIHRHWLRQEYREKRVEFGWVPTSKMIADGMTKALPKQRHATFVKMLQMEDISDQIVMEQRMEAMKDQIVKARSQKEDNDPDKEARLGYRGGKRRDPKRPQTKG